MTLPTMERLTFWFGACAVGFGALSAFSGIAAWYFAERVSGVKEAAATERAAKLEMDLSKQQERAANAEKSLLELQRAVRPRIIEPSKLVGALKGRKPPEGVELLFAPEDTEAASAAGQIARWLGPGDGGALGWRIIVIRPATPADAFHEVPSHLPSAVRAGALAGPTLLVKNLPPSDLFLRPVDDKTPLVIALFWALKASGMDVAAVGDHPTLPPGVIRIVIGQK